MVFHPPTSRFIVLDLFDLLFELRVQLVSKKVPFVCLEKRYAPCSYKPESKEFSSVITIILVNRTLFSDSERFCFYEIAFISHEYLF